jgi:4-amino-4-deoxy-L-arabinose transferase-like glycosyltransferase
MAISYQKHIKPLFSDVRFWLLVFFLIRLVGITHPPLESGHSWRQALTNMIARNFYEVSPNILYTRIDLAGANSGITTSEFPLYNYLIFLVSKVFGFNHWHGRWINLVVSTIGLHYFYKLIAKTINPKLALYATIVALASLWFSYSRKIMPDTFSVSLVFIGLYNAYCYLKDGKWLNLLAFFTLCTLGVLSKIPALSLMSCLVVVPFIKEIKTTRKVWLGIAGITGFSLVLLWYFYWVPHIFETYNYHLYFPRSFSEGFNEIMGLLPQFFEKFYFSALKSFVAFACFLVGIYYVVKSKNRLLQLALISISAVFAVFIVKTGLVFPTHGYYIVPFAPIMALIAAYFLQKLPSKFAAIVLTVIVVESIANHQHDFFIRDSQVYKLELEQKLNNALPDDGLVIINGGSSPVNMYFAHRKGWVCDNENLVTNDFVESKVLEGAKYLIVDKHYGDAHTLSYDIIFDDQDYIVYKISSNPSASFRAVDDRKPEESFTSR